MRKTGVIFILSVMFWLGGAGCALCCSVEALRVCCEAPSTEAADCEEPACCQMPAKRDPGVTSIENPETIHWCDLLPDDSELAVVPRAAGDSLAAPPKTPAALVSAPLPRQPLFAVRATPRSRGATYLRCCVLLI